jgi:hypothetical protein
MNRTQLEHILPALNLLITTEVESVTLASGKTVRESLGIKFLDCKNRVASGKNIPDHLPSDEPNTCVTAHRKNELI